MKIAEMNWMQVGKLVEHEDRCIIPIGSVEQNAYLSVFVDGILAEKMACEAAEPLGVPVFPVIPFSQAYAWVDYPGTVTLRLSTFSAMLEDVLNSVKRSGFRRILIMNGHGGNTSIGSIVAEWTHNNRDATIKVHEWWTGPKAKAVSQTIDPVGSHGAWLENFAIARVANAQAPEGAKKVVDFAKIGLLDPAQRKQALGDGSFGGAYQKTDGEMNLLWIAAVEEIRELVEKNWRT